MPVSTRPCFDGRARVAHGLLAKRAIHVASFAQRIERTEEPTMRGIVTLGIVFALLGGFGS